MVAHTTSAAEMFSVKRMVLLLAALAAAACNFEIVGPHDDELRLELSATPDEITPGDTVTLVARLVNGRDEDVRLDFDDGCQVLAFVVNGAGEVVFPLGGNWGCPAALTSLELDDGDSVEVEFEWTGEMLLSRPGEVPARSEPLPRGTYRAFAASPAGRASSR